MYSWRMVGVKAMGSFCFFEGVEPFFWAEEAKAKPLMEEDMLVERYLGADMQGTHAVVSGWLVVGCHGRAGQGRHGTYDKSWTCVGRVNEWSCERSRVHSIPRHPDFDCHEVS